MTKQTPKQITLPHDRWAYLVTLHSKSNEPAFKILIVSKTRLPISEVVERFKTESYPDTLVEKIEHPGANQVQILE